MGTCCSSTADIPYQTTAIPEEKEEITIPDEEPEDPAAIFFLAITRLAKTCDLNYPDHKLDEFCEKYENDFQSIDLLEGDTVFREGDDPDGVYVVIRGNLSVTDVDKNEEVMRIFKKDFFFDVETVYNMKCHYRVTAFNACTVYKVPSTCVIELIKGLEKPHILQWYVRRRYPPNLESLNKKIVHNKTCISVMKQVPMFSLWQNSTVEAFLDYMDTNPMVFYHPGSRLIKQGSRGGDMHILVRGSVNLTLDEDAYILEEEDTPVVIGEEGVFDEGALNKFTITTDAPCYIITINKHWIWHASDNVWEFAEGAEPHWTNTVKKWKKEFSERDPKLYASSYGPYLSIELVYQWMRGTKSFRCCSARYVYELAKCGDALLLRQNGFFDFSNLERGCLLVLKGELHLVQNKEPDSAEENEPPHHVYHPRDLVYYTKTKQSLYLQAKTECLLIKFSVEDLMNEMKHTSQQDIDFLRDDRALTEN